jgi:MoaA/NifB/PqqE/SkfB family radical SAM enzyme
MKKVTTKGGIKKSELSWNQYRKMFDTLPFTVSNVEIVGGGEPLLFPEIEKLLKKIKSKRLAGSLITNGVVMTPKISEILVKQKWDRVRVSINAGSKEIYPLSNGAHYFDKVVKNVSDLIKIRGNSQFPKVCLHFVLQKSNYKDLDNFIALAKDIGVDQINFDTLIHDSPKKIMLSDLEILELSKNLKKYRKNLKIENNVNEVLEILKNNSVARKKSYFSGRYCQIIQSMLEIGSEGEVVPCCMAYGEPIAKNLKEMSLRQIWKEGADFRKKLKQGKFADFCYKKCNYSLKEK